MCRPTALRDDSLVECGGVDRISAGKRNRWERALSGQRTATVDLLVPSYRTRLRQAVQHGSTNTVEVGGLAEAMRRPAVRIVGEVTLTDGEVLSLDVLLQDLASLLSLKLHARRVRRLDRDAIDLWTCLELLAAEGAMAAFGDAEFDPIRGQLEIEFAHDGPVVGVVAGGVNEEEAARRRTRIRGLARAIGGPV